ncbi:uncharacterized protein TNCV_3477811 [Trichonephila clavipes]|nr:uncharacterized protein TNCV_3477811 [Trichonephila clavipes]
MSSGNYLPQFNIGVQGGTEGVCHIDQNLFNGVINDEPGDVDGYIRVRWHRDERTLAAGIRHCHTGPSPGVMVLGAIGCMSQSLLVLIGGTLNSSRYISGTVTHCLQVLTGVFKTLPETESAEVETIRNGKRQRERLSCEVRGDIRRPNREKEAKKRRDNSVFGNSNYTGMWVRRGSTNLMVVKVVFLRGLLSPIRVVDLTLKGHLLGWAPDWYQILGSALVKNTATDFAQLKAALSKSFPAIRNKKDLEKRGMSEEALVHHKFVTHELQVQDYVEVRNSQNTVQMLEVLSKFEERYSCKAMRGSRNSDNVERRGCNERRMCNSDESRRNWRNSEVVRSTE